MSTGSHHLAAAAVDSDDHPRPSAPEVSGDGGREEDVNATSGSGGGDSSVAGNVNPSEAIITDGSVAPDAATSSFAGENPRVLKQSATVATVDPDPGEVADDPIGISSPSLKFDDLENRQRQMDELSSSETVLNLTNVAAMDDHDATESPNTIVTREVSVDPNHGGYQHATESEDLVTPDGAVYSVGSTNAYVATVAATESPTPSGNGLLHTGFNASGKTEIVEEENRSDPAFNSEKVISSFSSIGGASVMSSENGPRSPSSSGYDAELGSSVVSMLSTIEGAGNSIQDDNLPHEDDTSDAWKKRKKHFFILSYSGKPIYSRYGDEHKLAGFSATLQAIISYVEQGGDRIKYIRFGKYQTVFLVKGPLYLACISCTDEPKKALMEQLELIYC